MKKLLLILLIFFALNINASIDYFAEAISQIKAPAFTGRRTPPPVPPRKVDPVAADPTEVDPTVSDIKDPETKKAIERFKRESEVLDKRFEKLIKNKKERVTLAELNNKLDNFKLQRIGETQIAKEHSKIESEVSVLIGLLRKNKRLKRIKEKEYFKNSMRYILEVNPQLIQQINDLLSDAGIRNEDGIYDMTVDVFRRAIDLLAYQLYLKSASKQRAGKRIEFGAEKDIFAALCFLPLIAPMYQEAKANLADEEFKDIDGSTKSFVKNIKEQIDRVWYFFRKYSKELTGVEIDIFKYIFDENEERRVWGRSEYAGNPNEERIAYKWESFDNNFIEKLKSKDGKRTKREYYKPFFIELEEIVESIENIKNKKVDKKVCDYESAVREQFIISVIKRISKHSNIGTSKRDLQNDLREKEKNVKENLNKTIAYLKILESTSYIKDAVESLKEFIEVHNKEKDIYVR